MSFTSHGHHIPFTFLEDEKPERVEGCGGVRMCTTCTMEGARYLPAFAGQNGRPMDDLEFLLAAHNAVTQQLREHLQEDRGPADQETYLMLHNTTVALAE